MRRSAKEQRITSPDAQLLQPAFTEAIALSSSGIADAELSNELVSGNDKLKTLPRKSVRS
jgi:hypothetical protein